MGYMAGEMTGDHLYVLLTFEDSDMQIVIEALGPATVIGMVTDVVNGIYTTKEGKKVSKIEVGAKFEQNSGMRIDA
jgi:hypothetical protein